MQELKSLIRAKTKRQADQGAEIIEDDHPKNASHLCESNVSKKARLHTADTATSIGYLDDELFKRIDHLSADYKLSNREAQLIDSCLSLMKLPRRIRKESDLNRIKRCKEALTIRLSRNDEQMHPNSPTQSASVTSADSNDVTWAQVEKNLRSSSGGKLFEWLKSQMSAWYAELADVGNSESDRSFKDACKNVSSLIEDIRIGRIRDDIHTRLSKIAEYAINGMFPEAEEEYMRIAVGNQAWLIGVGNCFIQERSSLDRIREASHIMNDDRVRDYIQWIKRFLSRTKSRAISP